MTRHLLALAVAATAFLALPPAANACDGIEHCPGGTVVCRLVGCPAICTADPVPVLNEKLCAP